MYDKISPDILPVGEQLSMSSINSRLSEVINSLQGIIDDSSNPAIDTIYKAQRIVLDVQSILQASSAWHHSLASNLPAILFVLNPDGTILYVNKTVKHILGYDPSELIGTNWWSLYLAAGNATQIGELYSKISEGNISRLEITFEDKDGCPRVLDVTVSGTLADDGNLSLISGIGIDITNQQRVFIEPKEWYWCLFESNPQPMWIYDLETLHFVAVNDATVQRYGYSRQEFHSMTIRDIHPDKDVFAILKDVAERPHGLNNEGISRHKKRDGSDLYVDIASHTLTWSGRSCALVTAIEITNR